MIPLAQSPDVEVLETTASRRRPWAFEDEGIFAFGYGFYTSKKKVRQLEEGNLHRPGVAAVIGFEAAKILLEDCPL